APLLTLDPATAVAAVPFSSGTTGIPKAVRLTHRNLVANLEQHRPAYRIGPGDTVCAAIPLFHIYGLTMVLNAALRNGATVVTMPRYHLPAYLGIIATHRVTKLHLAPPMVLDLALRPEVASHDLSSLRTAVCGAAPLDPELGARAGHRIGVPIGQGYGMTEASPGVTYVPEDLVAEAPAGSVGRLIAGTEARVVPVGMGDAASNSGEAWEADGTAGRIGELWVRGPQVVSVAGLGEGGFAVSPDGWFRTGDLVRVGPGGWWWVVDRLKELIKYKGYQVAPAELEALLLSHPRIADAAVAGIPDARAGEVPAAWVVARQPVDADSLLRWVAERVAPHKRIREVRFIAAIPRSASGKILRRVLRAEAVAAASRGVGLR
ncbi:MAG: AMP-binding protein, partial [Candidatus Dormibacteria bacterium]